MRDKLISYIDFLFAGMPNNARTADVKAEILQNSLDRFDDLVSGGHSPEQAYSMAISGIGDVSELLTAPENEIVIGETVAKSETEQQAEEYPKQDFKASRDGSLMVGIAIGLYVVCVVPILAIGPQVGVPLMFAMAAIATALIVIGGNLKRFSRIFPLGSPKVCCSGMIMRGMGVGLYVFSLVPVVAGLPATLGVSLMFVFIAAATVLIIVGSGMVKQGKRDNQQPAGAAPLSLQEIKLNKIASIVCSVIFFVGLGVYMLISMETGAWYITWLIFVIISCVCGVVRAIFDLIKIGKKEER